MSTTTGAISSVIPMPNVAKADAGLGPGQGASQPTAPPKRDTKPEADPFPPMPIQPLSSRMLATFMQNDIELYGSMFGA